MACFHCECKRPRDEYMENQMQVRQQDHRAKFERVPGNREEISNAWNLNFDDDESDGADVAAFEYADSARMGDNFPSNDRPLISNTRGFKDDVGDDSGITDSRSRSFADSSSRPGTGFDDFDDEDDVESYEVDTHNTVVKTEFPTHVSDDDFSDFEDMKPIKSGRRDPLSNEKPQRSVRGNVRYDSPDEDRDLGSDEDLSIHPDWKSSHVANSSSKSGKRQNGSSRSLSFGSDDEFTPGSDSDDDHGRMGRKDGRHRSKQSNRGRSNSEDEYGSESGDDGRTRGVKGGRGSKGPTRFDSERSSRNGFRGKHGRERGDDDFVPRDEYKFTKDGSKGFKGKPSGRGRGGNNFKGGDDSGSFDDSDDDYQGSSRNSRVSNRGRQGGNSFRGSKDSDDDDFDRSSRSSRGSTRGRRGGGYGGNRGGGQRGGGFDRELYGKAKDRFSGACGFDDDVEDGGRNRQKPRRGGFGGDRQRGRFGNKSSRDMDFNDDRPRRERIIER